MTVVLLDPRWPDQIPVDIFGVVSGPVTYTEEVPVSVRWNLGDVIVETDPTGAGVLVSTDDSDSRVLERIARGERVIAASSRDDHLNQARRVMARALQIGEFERLQTHQTLVAYLEEEVAELIEVITAGDKGAIDDDKLCSELSDLLLQVLFHAEVASRRGAFDLDDVAEAFVNKMRSRAPYLFDGTTDIVLQEEQDRLWLEGKKRENDALG